MGKGAPKLVLSTSTSLRNEISNQQVDYLNFSFKKRVITSFQAQLRC